MDDTTTSFTSKVNQKLKRIGKTQKQLSFEIDVDYSTLNKILNNKRELDFSTAVKIAKNLNFSLDKLMNNTKDQSYEDIITNLDDLLFELKQMKRTKK